MSIGVRPYRIDVAQADLDDLLARLARRRLPDQPDGVNWETGTELGFMQHLLEYWLNRFDWRVQETRLNALPQYVVQVGEIPVHFICIEGRGSDPIPLLLGHGWPGSFVEFLKIIPLLTDPASWGHPSTLSFTVVAPSLPGFCLSYQEGQPRLSAQEMATCLNELMTTHLGFSRYGVQGGDWGASVAASMALQRPDSVLGIHLNFLPLQRNLQWVMDSQTDHREYAEELVRWQREEGAYGSIQGTRPQTLAYAMSDSPVALAAWIVEKMRAWCDCGGDLTSVLSLDDVLTNISLYWFTNCSNSAFWPYYARAHGSWPIPDGTKVQTPLGYCEFPKEILRPPRSLAQKSFEDIRQWNSMSRGGHFAAWEQPHALATEIFSFFEKLRS